MNDDDDDVTELIKGLSGNMKCWYAWGAPIVEQANAEYLTYARYKQQCQEDGVEPVRLERFCYLMHQRGLCIAPEDEGGDRLFWCYDYAKGGAR